MTKESRRDTDSDTIAYFNFDNALGVDMSIEGNHNLKYNEKVLGKLIPSFNGKLKYIRLKLNIGYGYS